MTPKDEEGREVGAMPASPLQAQQAPGANRAADLQRQPELAAELLEPDQTVAAKRARFGRKPLSRWERGLLWTLRIYVVAMQIIVIITVIRALHAAR